MYRTQANLDERTIEFLPRKSFFYPFSWVKKTIIFLWGKDNKKIQCYNTLWHGGYVLSKDQENTLACFRDIRNLKFLFFLPHLTIRNHSIYVFKCVKFSNDCLLM